MIFLKKCPDDKYVFIIILECPLNLIQAGVPCANTLHLYMIFLYAYVSEMICSSVGETMCGMKIQVFFLNLVGLIFCLRESIGKIRLGTDKI